MGSGWYPVDMITVSKMILLVVVILAVVNILTKLWREWWQSRKQPVDMDAQIDRDINDQHHWFPVSLLGWFLFIFDAPPRLVIALGIFFAVFSKVAYNQEHFFAQHSVRVKAAIVDASKTSHFLDERQSLVEFRTRHRKKIRTSIHYRPRSGETAILLRYSSENPSNVKPATDLYAVTWVFGILAGLTLLFGIYRWYLFRPRPPLKDWRKEI
jgi:hypothetical protein